MIWISSAYLEMPFINKVRFTCKNKNTFLALHTNRTVSDVREQISNPGMKPERGEQTHKNVGQHYRQSLSKFHEMVSKQQQSGGERLIRGCEESAK